MAHQQTRSNPPRSRPWPATVAFACFAYLTLLGVVAAVVLALPISFEGQQVIGMVVGIPLGMVGFLGAAVAVGLTVFSRSARKEPGLVAMSAALVTSVVFSVFADGLPREGYEALQIGLGLIQGLAILVIGGGSAWWLFTVVAGVLHNRHSSASQ